MEGFPKITKENNLEKPKIKEGGVDFVFEKNPELSQIGTKEQYSEYLDTIFPDSKLKDIVYAGSAEDFDEFITNDTHNKKNFGIYFGSWISHYFGEGARGYKYRKAVLLNIKNPRIINGITLSDENNNENNEAIGLGSADAGDIKKFYNIKEEDGIIELGHFHGNEEIEYSESENIYNKEAINLIEKINEEAKKIGGENYFDKLVEDKNLQLISHSKMKESIKNGLSLGNTLQEAVVFDPELIHILGSNKDLENFKKFVENNSDSHA